MPPQDLPILWVGNPQTLDKTITRRFNRAGLTLRRVRDVPQAKAYLQEHGLPAAVIIDLLDLGQAGSNFCEDLTEYAGLPIVLLSAGEETTSAADMFRCADMYLRRQESSAEELTIRLGRLLSRIQSFVYSSGRGIALGDAISFDAVGRTMTVGGDKQALTPTEAALLHVLIVHRGERVDSETLMSRVWRGGEGNANALRVHMHRLRRKLGDERTIETERGTGYRLTV